MKGIKLSTLRDKVCFINESRKSKGKLDLVQKINFLYLINKYKLFGLEKFSYNQLDQFIELLNAKEFRYKKLKMDLMEEKTIIEEDANEQVETLASKNEEKFNEKAVEKIVKQANDDQEFVDNEISKIDTKLNKIEQIKEDALTEKETIEIENSVNEESKEIVEENNINEESEETNIDLDNLGEKIIAATEESSQDTEEKKDSDVEHKDPLTDLVNTEIEMAEIIKNENQEDLSDAILQNVEVKEETKIDPYKELMDTFNKVLNDKGRVTQEGIAGMFKDFCEQIAITTNDICEKIQEEDKKIAIEIIASKDREISNTKAENELLNNEKVVLNSELNTANDTITERNKTIEELKAELEAKNAEIAKQNEQINSLNETINNKNNDISNLTAENKNFKIAIKTLMSTKSVELEEELTDVKTK